MKSDRMLLIEGWRFIPHSYAIVNQFQCLQFLKEPNLTVRHHDVPYFQPSWQATTGLFKSPDEEAIRGIAEPATGESPDAVLRITYPYNVSSSVGRRTVVFGTAELRCVPARYIASNVPLLDACRSCDALIVTPSKWSRDGFIHSGAEPDRVTIVPHGIDTSIFHPISPSERAAMRGQRKWNGFFFLTLGAMTPNKRMDVLLKAFAVVAQKHPHVRLVAKGLGALYRSRDLLKAQTTSLTPAELSLIQPRIIYLDQTLSFADMATLYQMADAYVSPYSAEGFNMPVLEAIASGLPVICTRGGSTDDFTTDDFALRVDSVCVSTQQTADASGFLLRVDFDHLVHQMMVAVESVELAEKARLAGPAFVEAGFTWRHVAQRLLRILFDADSFA
jgi:glycosyltransferase involved in cell wall biosynthesis